MIKHISKIPYVDIGLQHRAISKELLYEIEKVINHGQFVLGKEVDLFEKKLADLCGVKFSIGVSGSINCLIHTIILRDILCASHLNYFRMSY